MQKKVLIVGGTSGLGRKLAELYVERGDKVAVIGRRENLLTELKTKLGPSLYTIQADITNLGAEDFIDSIASPMGGIDIAIIAAAYVSFNDHLDWTIESKTIQTNTVGFAQMVNQVYHFFLEQGSGQIVVITSTAAARGNKGAPAYHATKAFQSTYAESLRLKLKRSHREITVTELVPGYMDTDMARGDRLFWVAPVEKAARQCIRAIDKKRAKAFITKRWWLIYYAQKFMPRFLYDPLITGNWKLKQDHKAPLNE
jgi:short-subunit dehydrogenase